MIHSYSSELDPPALLVPVRVCPVGALGGEEVTGLIDTGADASMIPEGIRRRLGLRPDGIRYLRGVRDVRPRASPTFSVTVSIGEMPSCDLEVFSGWEEYFIIGRDLLNDLVLHADGPSQLFELTHPPAMAGER